MMRLEGFANRMAALARGSALAERGVYLAALTLAIFAAAPAVAQASTSWQSGPLVESQDANCNTGNTEYEAGTWLSYYADPSNPPQVGQVYYVAIDMRMIGNPCAGAYADVNLVLPPGTTPAISSTYQVRCYEQWPGQTSFKRDTSSDCPQSLPFVALPDGQDGYSVDPIASPAFWPLAFVWTLSQPATSIELQVPVASSTPLNGSSKLQGYVQLADGQSNPTLQPTLAMIVNPSGAQNVSGANEQIGVLYPSPSITSNVQQPNTSTTVGVAGYVENNSNPGHVVAQVAYADLAGDCNAPGTIVYATPSVTLQDPQTQATGTITGLYADVSYCWRLVATVTSGAQTGTYDGNWEYFKTAGTYHAYAGEPGAASAPANPQCSTSGGNCQTSNCGTGATCSSGATLSGQTATLTATLGGTGSGSVRSASNIVCPSTCSHTYSAGATVTLTAAAASGSTFTGWSGGGCSGAGSCTVTLTANDTVTATFAAPPPTTTSTSTSSTATTAAGSSSGAGAAGSGGVGASGPLVTTPATVRTTTTSAAHVVVLTRAEKLAAANKVCRKLRAQHKRSACLAKARKRYGPPKPKATSKRRKKR